MARYSIDGQILTDMADAVRASRNESKPTSLAGSGECAWGAAESSRLSLSYNKVEGQRYRITFYCNNTAKDDSLYNLAVYVDGSPVYVQVSTEPQTLVGVYYGASTYQLFDVSPGLLSPKPLTFTYTIEFVNADDEPIEVGGALYTPEDIVTVLQNVPVAPAPITLTGACNYGCSGAMASIFIKMYGDLVSTSAITNAANMFENYSNESIPFALNLTTNSTLSVTMTNMFYNAKNLKVAPTFNSGFQPDSINNLFSGCNNLREFPEDYGWNWNWTRLNTYQYAIAGAVFNNCFSLRRIPASFLSNMYGIQTSPTYTFMNNMCNSCYALDELVNVPVHKGKLTSNVMNYMLRFCYRLREFTFETNEDGSPKTANWTNQVLDFTQYSGWVQTKSNVLNYNSGITADKEVTDWQTYQALKNDPDWFSCNKAWSRYDFGSLTRTINSLPDTSAAGGKNEIKVDTDAGNGTDDGAMNALTDYEDIAAIAAAKGWTIALM